MTLNQKQLNFLKTIAALRVGMGLTDAELKIAILFKNTNDILIFFNKTVNNPDELVKYKQTSGPCCKIITPKNLEANIIICNRRSKKSGKLCNREIQHIGKHHIHNIDNACLEVFG